MSKQQQWSWRGRVAGVALLAALAGCRDGADVAAPPPPEVSVSQPVERTIADHYETTGQAAAVESVEVRARVSGHLVEIGFQDGAVVKKGDRLFLIDPRPYEAEVLRAQGELGRWQAALRKAVADVERAERLLPQGAASERELETAIAARDTARAEITAARAGVQQANLDLEFTRVTAPIDGQVSRTNVTVGNLIHVAGVESNVLTTLVSIDPVHVYFDIDERTLLEVREQRRESAQPTSPETVRAANIPVEIGLATEEGYPHRGVFDFIDNRVDPSTGTIKARALFDNRDRILTPGLFVRVRVPTGEPHPSLLVAERAIGTDQGNKFVYVVNQQNAVEYRAVKLGRRSDDGLRVITEGVRPGEWLIVNGIQRARPGLTVTPQQVAMVPQRKAPPAVAAGPPEES